MNCAELQALSVSDEPGDHVVLENHAADCPPCAEFLVENRRLYENVEAWNADSPAPPPGLENRILAAIRNVEAARVTPFPSSPLATPVTRWRPRHWAFAAAAAIAAVTLSVVLIQQRPVPEGSLSQAVNQVRLAERAYVRAIATLEKQAATSLARASDPLLAGEQAVILLNYQGRLGHLDAVIAEVRGFLDESPGHSGGHTVLLAAYKEKSEVLQEVIDLKLGDT